MPFWIIMIVFNKTIHALFLKQKQRRLAFPNRFLHRFQFFLATDSALLLSRQLLQSIRVCTRFLIRWSEVRPAQFVSQIFLRRDGWWRVCPPPCRVYRWRRGRMLIARKAIVSTSALTPKETPPTSAKSCWRKVNSVFRRRLIISSLFYIFYYFTKACWL